MKVCRFVIYSISTKLHMPRSDACWRLIIKVTLNGAPQLKSLFSVRFIVYGHAKHLTVVITVFTLWKIFINKLCFFIVIMY